MYVRTYVIVYNASRQVGRSMLAMLIGKIGGHSDEHECMHAGMHACKQVGRYGCRSVGR